MLALAPEHILSTEGHLLTVPSWGVSTTNTNNNKNRHANNDTQAKALRRTWAPHEAPVQYCAVASFELPAPQQLASFSHSAVSLPCFATELGKDFCTLFLFLARNRGES